MKKLLSVLIALVAIQTAYAQQAGRFRYQMDLGFAAPKNGGIGALVHVEPQVLLLDNLALGLRMGATGMVKDVTYFEIPDDYDGELAANLSVSGTANYYFKLNKGNLAPYVGAGFGYYALGNVEVQGDHFEDAENLQANFAWAPMVRLGVELNKFRLGAEYNFVPSSNLQNVSGEVIGRATNEYFAFTLGFFVGGGRWGRL
ncbi:outer membrane beta-barrel protein [Algoriphagus litoralis]|uniref:outer membrane beta-barrel protein n=1 Tax=Algoriphagus litoralis TaxID=2202829 RepID=UPI000DBA4DC3|nr:outer membrane beta-barrel protein [Algoriphagus litoralis]